MLDEIDQHIEVLKNEARTGPIDIYDSMLNLTFKVIARAIFSQSIPKEELSLLSRHITQLQEFVVRQIRQPFLNPLFSLNGTLKRHEKIRDINNDLTLRYIKARKQEQDTKDDLLQMLLDARYEGTNEPMPTKQIKDEVTILFVAGHDTSANALAWFWHVLGKHPLVEKKIRAEIKVLNGSVPTIADLPKFPYTLAALEETMRLYPPAWVTDRQALEDDEYQGLIIPKGTYMITYFYGLHRNDEYWPNPEEFQPERFLPPMKKAHQPYTYLPFGGGPRLCIGNHFALLEMQLVVIRMLQHFKLTPIGEKEILAFPLVTLRPKTAVWMQLTPLD